MQFTSRERLGAINAEIAEKTSTAQAKWAAFENARSRVGAAKDEAATKAATNVAESVHLEYAHAAAELKELEAVRDGIYRQIAGDKPLRGPHEEKDRPGEHRAGGGFWLPGAKSIGERAAESFELKELQRSGVLNSERGKFQAKLADISRPEFKTLLTGLSDTSAGAFITNQRVGPVAQPQRQTTVLDLVTIGETNSDAVEYARQTSFTNVAVEVAEATTIDTGTKPEATIAFEKVVETVKTIAHWIPATRRALADAAQLRMLIDSVLRYGLQLRVENQVINGNGTGENLRGILATSGILTQPKGADSVIDALHKAITQLRLGYVEPNGIAMHPTDWELVQLAKASGSGEYLVGGPGEAGTPRLWGLPVVVTTAVPDDTSLVGDFRQFAVWVREGAQVLASDSHESYFTRNLVALLCESRLAAGVLLPAAFCSVTSVD